MRLRVVTLVFSCSALAAVWACSLNPQPFPPDNPDAAHGPSDAGKGKDGSFGSDAAGNMPDAETDGEPGPEGDAGTTDADASDALLDVSVDAPEDALDGGSD